jgi:hypothetical protein
MARQEVFKQTSGNKSEHRKCANKIKQQIKQSNKSSKQTDQANKQIKQTNKIAKGSIYLALGKPSRQVEIKRTSGNESERRIQGQ